MGPFPRHIRRRETGLLRGVDRGGFQFLAGGFQVGRTPGTQPHAGSPGGELPGQRQPDPAGTAREENFLSEEEIFTKILWHADPPSMKLYLLDKELSGGWGKYTRKGCRIDTVNSHF